MWFRQTGRMKRIQDSIRQLRDLWKSFKPQLEGAELSLPQQDTKNGKKLWKNVIRLSLELRKTQHQLSGMDIEYSLTSRRPQTGFPLPISGVGTMTLPICSPWLSQLEQKSHTTATAQQRWASISQSYVVLLGTSNSKSSFPTRVPTSPAECGLMQNIHCGFVLKVRGHHQVVVRIVKAASRPNFIDCQISGAGGKLRGRAR